MWGPVDTRDWLKQINAVLHREWCPIHCDVPEDEYESYARPLATMLLANAPDAKLIAHLEWAEMESIGLGGPFSLERAEKVIATLRALGVPDKR
jgi:hypothetical protein